MQPQETSHADTRNIAVDLDHTLVRTDVFVEGLVRLVLSNPLYAVLCLFWVLRGRAYFKTRVADAAPPRADLLPYNQDLIDWLTARRQEGARIVLATAAARPVADAVADHLGIFDAVLCSENDTNLKGARKAAAIEAHFEGAPFVYAGDCQADVPIWQRAAGAIMVDVPARMQRSVEEQTPVVARFETRKRLPVAALIKALRPYQWAKNGLVFVPVITAGAYFVAADWLAAAGGFIAMSLAASGVYLWNDASDLEADRAHPRKRKRPFASGRLPIGYAALGLPLFVLSAGIAFAVGALAQVVAYLLLSVSYSSYFKRIPLVDVFFLSALFIIRIVVGGAATGHEISSWLLGFAGFFFLGLALMKRAAELGFTQAKIVGRGYDHQDRELITFSGVAAGFAACIVLALYINDPTITAQYANAALLWLLVPIFLFWLLNMWRATIRGQMTDDPIVFAAKTPMTWGIAVCIVICLLAARSL